MTWDKRKENANPTCSVCGGSGYQEIDVPYPHRTLCECTFEDTSCTFFEELGRTVDRKVDSVREMMDILSRLGLS